MSFEGEEINIGGGGGHEGDHQGFPPLKMSSILYKKASKRESNVNRVSQPVEGSGMTQMCQFSSL